MDCGDNSLNIHYQLTTKASDLDGFLAGLAPWAPRAGCRLSWVLGDFTLGSSEWIKEVTQKDILQHPWPSRVSTSVISTAWKVRLICILGMGE